MEAPRIRAFRIQDFAAGADPLAGLEDPHGYIAPCTAEWVDLLQSNPRGQSTDLALVLAIDGARVVGRLGFYAAEVSVRGARHKTYWAQAFFLDGEYRTTGAGGMLLLPAISALKCMTGAGNSAPATVALCERLGFQVLGSLRRFVYFYRTAPIAAKYLKWTTAQRLATTLGDPLLHLYNWRHLRKSRARTALEFRPVHRFGDDLDALLAGETRSFFPRDSATLNWILRHRRIEAFTIHDGSRLLGYCLLKTMHMGPVSMHRLPAVDSGRILDYYLPGDALDAKQELLLFAIQHFAKREIDLLECQVYDEGMPELCQRLGMLEVGGYLVYFRPPRGVSLEPNESWFLTFGTGDVILEEL